MMFGKRRIPIRINILTLFLSLLSITAASIVLFTYSKNYRSIERFSRETIELASGAIVENVSCLFLSTRELVESSAGWFLTPEDFSFDAEWPSYFLDVIRYHPRIPFFYIAAANGNYVEAGNLHISGQTHFFSEPEKPLPKEALYTMQFFVRENRDKAEETVYYYDKDLNVVAQEHLVEQTYDPRVRPWYIGTEKARGPYWTDIYRYYDRPDLGFSFADALFDQNKEFMGVIAADFSFNLLSEFFLKQKIGKTGKAYILDEQGKILIPESASSEDVQTIAKAMEIFNKEHARYFSFYTDEENRYLAYIANLPIALSHDWKIAIIVPFSDFFADFVRSNRQVIYLIVGISLLAMTVVIYFAQLLSNPISKLSGEIDRVRQLDLTSEERVYSRIKEIDQMDQSVASMRHAFRSFVCYVPKEIVKQLLEKQAQITVGGEKKKLSIFFSEIAGFSQIAQSRTTEQLMPLLEEYFKGVSNIVLESKGIIDKYMGDTVMAFWGAPLEVPNQTEQCCLAALRCKAFASKLNETRRKEQKPEFWTRIGIDEGVAIVGNVGTSERLNYTAIGDAVNLASRLKQLNEHYHTAIVISEHVRKGLNSQFLLRPLDNVEIRGKKEREKVYELVAYLEKEESFAHEKELCRRFAEGYEAFYRGDRKQARELFEALQRDFPEDEPTRIYLSRLK